MGVEYGVLRGKVDRWKREDPPANSNKSPHLQIRIMDGTGRAWRSPVNVRSQDKSLVIFHRADPLQGHPILTSLDALPTGFTDLMSVTRGATTALDYSRAPLFDWPTGIALPPTGDPNVPDDDLQDVVSRRLTDLQAVGGDLFVFGSVWHDQAVKPGIDQEFGTKDGVHDVHMNQGNKTGDHSEDNGVFHDGG